MPEKSKVQETTHQTPVGPVKQINMCSVSNSGLYLACAVELPAALTLVASDSDIDSFRKEFLNGLVKPFDGKVVSSQRFTDGELSGDEFEIETIGMKLMGRVFVVRGKLFALITNKAVEAPTFYKSFELARPVGR